MIVKLGVRTSKIKGLYFVLCKYAQSNAHACMYPQIHIQAHTAAVACDKWGKVQNIHPLTIYNLNTKR